MRWGKSEGARLKQMIRDAGWKQDPLAEAIGVGAATLKRILAGSDPGEDRLGAICATIGATPAQVFGGGDAEDSGTVEVDVYDVDVSAGHGREALGEDPIRTWPFPRDWIVDHFGRDPDLALVRVAGESMEPELRDGDMVMIDLARPRIRDGLHVVRVDDQLMIKRVQVEGATVRLKSANAAYDDVVIRLEPEQERFVVIGRAGWAGKLL